MWHVKGSSRIVPAEPLILSPEKSCKWHISSFLHCPGHAVPFVSFHIPFIFPSTILIFFMQPHPFAIMKCWYFSMLKKVHKCFNYKPQRFSFHFSGTCILLLLTTYREREPEILRLRVWNLFSSRLARNDKECRETKSWRFNSSRILWRVNVNRLSQWVRGRVGKKEHRIKGKGMGMVAVELQDDCSSVKGREEKEKSRWDPCDPVSKIGNPEGSSKREGWWKNSWKKNLEEVEIETRAASVYHCYITVCQCLYRRRTERREKCLEGKSSRELRVRWRRNR